MLCYEGWCTDDLLLGLYVPRTCDWPDHIRLHQSTCELEDNLVYPDWMGSRRAHRSRRPRSRDLLARRTQEASEETAESWSHRCQGEKSPFYIVDFR